MARPFTDDASDTATATLAQFDEQWTKTSTASSEEPYSDIPDGMYDAVIEEARLTETASTGRHMVVWALRIKGPQAVNRVIMKNRVITENTLGYLKEELEKCGLTVSRLSELPVRLKDITDRPVAIEKRTKDGRANVYFRWKAARVPDNLLSDDIPF